MKYKLVSKKEEFIAEKIADTAVPPWLNYYSRINNLAIEY